MTLFTLFSAYATPALAVALVAFLTWIVDLLSISGERVSQKDIEFSRRFSKQCIKVGLIGLVWPIAVPYLVIKGIYRQQTWFLKEDEGD